MVEPTVFNRVTLGSYPALAKFMGSSLIGYFYFKSMTYEEWVDLGNPNPFNPKLYPFRKRFYEENPILCKNCGTQVSYEQHKNNSIFCSRNCSGSYNTRQRQLYGKYNHKDIVGKKLREGYAAGTYTHKPHKNTSSIASVIPYNGTTHSKRSRLPKYQRDPLFVTAMLPWLGYRYPKVLFKGCQECGAEFVVKYYQNRTYCSKECRNKNIGGIKPNSGRGIYGYYKNHRFQSSWEFYWIVFSLDNNVPFLRNTIGFPYTYRGESHLFYPDFHIADIGYVEIKGYYDAKTTEKIRQFPSHLKLQVIDSKTIDQYKSYVDYTYGKNYIQEFAYRLRLKKCLHCETEFPYIKAKKFCNNRCTRRYYSGRTLKEKSHGTKYSYESGCRCTLCRKANAVASHLFYEKNREHMLALKKDYYKKNKEKINEKRRKKRAISSAGRASDLHSEGQRFKSDKVNKHAGVV